MATPIIPWIGGKRRLVDLLLSRFPAHKCYVEVFAGGAALYFLRPAASVEVVNDINGDLVNQRLRSSNKAFNRGPTKSRNARNFSGRFPCPA
ncbi:DNA adenine methylase [Ralstonia sp. CHL-2022]|uniref:DNA adenine methylase n=1 Tax=Ralstonia mojiangensis TaxID=2953895 RepID=A0AAE3I9Z4_9RALS|nr:DNA adenine methylase [Ralstonia mojiangensis]MCT7319057.1 DNA adenine methylase [Ralstonia mojiangensis]